MTTKPTAVNKDLVAAIGARVMAAHIAGKRDVSEIGDGSLDRLADVSVRAAIAIDAAIPRAEERLAAEAKAADDAEAAQKAADAAQKKDDAAAAKTAAKAA